MSSSVLSRGFIVCKINVQCIITLKSVLGFQQNLSKTQHSYKIQNSSNCGLRDRLVIRIVLLLALVYTNILICIRNLNICGEELFT